MNFHEPVQPYLRHDASFRQPLYQQKVISPSIDGKVWFGVRNLILVLCPVVLACSVWLTSIAHHLERAIRTVEDVRHELTERQIELLAKRSQLFSSDNILLLAATRLSLEVPDEERVVRCR